MENSIAQGVEVPDWARIAAELAAPFDPEEVDFRAQGRPNAESGKAQILAYIDARCVQDRLDAVVGIQNWSFRWWPVGQDNKGELVSVKATLTIYSISKSDVGVASNFEGDKGAVSGGLKRAAVHWGIGRYLYSLPATWQPVDKYGHITPAILAALRKTLPTPEVHKPTLAGKRIPATITVEPDRHVAPITLMPQVEPTVVPVTVTQAHWDQLKIRVKNNGMIATKAAWEKLMEQTGASYEDTLAKVEDFERNNLQKLAISNKGRH